MKHKITQTDINVFLIASGLQIKVRKVTPTPRFKKPHPFALLLMKLFFKFIKELSPAAIFKVIFMFFKIKNN